MNAATEMAAQRSMGILLSFPTELTLVIFLELQLIAYYGVHCRGSAAREFQHRVRSEAKGHARPRHFMPDFEYPTFLVQEQHIDGKLHAEGMNCLRGCDPQTLARLQAGMFQKSGPPLGTGIGHADAITE